VRRIYSTWAAAIMSLRMGHRCMISSGMVSSCLAVASREWTGMVFESCCNLNCYSDSSLLPFYTLLTLAPVSSSSLVPAN
jgi:hypothetical protein